MGKKVNNATASIRREAIMEWLCDGLSTGQIVRFASEQWQIGRRQIESYIQDCNQEFEKIHAENMKQKYGRAVKRTQRLFRKVKEKEKYQVAAFLAKELNDLEGVKEAHKEENAETFSPVTINIIQK